MISISANLNIMIKAAEKASKSIIRDFGEVEKLQVLKKGPNDFVTKTDKYVEKVLIEELSKTKKNYSFITEETGNITNKDISLSAVGINRWEPLFFDPQKNCIENFTRGGENSILNTLDTYVNNGNKL